MALRAPRDILATLDATGSLDGVPFMPEMLGYFGRTFTVSNRVERACDAVSRVRRMSETVMLDDLRCDGAGHGGCQAGCRIYWKEAWLERVASGTRESFAPDVAYERLREVATQHARTNSSDVEAPPTYRCQATELLRSSELIPFWDIRSFMREITSGNVSLGRFVRIVANIVRNERRRRSTGDQRAFRRAGTGVQPTSTLNLQPGSRVRIRQASEIAETLDANSKLRGLWFDREMLPYCGTTATVKAKVERFIDENSGEMVELKSDCFILDGVVCKGEVSDGRWFCCREIYPWWREAWLEPETQPSPSR